jgi:uncharacterized protein (TIGR00251 family)
MAESGVTVRVRLTPRGGKDAVIGYRAADGVLLLRVAAPPVDGAANKACLELVANTLGVKRSQVTLIGGETARDKRFIVVGVTEIERNQRLGALPPVADL